MTTVQVTDEMRERLAMAIDRKGLKYVSVSNQIGAPRNFVTKFLKKEIRTISLERLDQLEDFLGLQLSPVIDHAGRDVSPLAAELSDAAAGNKALMKVLESLAELASSQVEAPEKSPRAHIPVVHQKKLIKIGAEITRIVHQWEEAEDPHYAKIGAETLAFLREFYSKGKY